MNEVKPDMQQTLPPNYRRNVLAFAGDWISFGIGMSFASGSTVLPALVNQLSGSPLAVGLISTLGSGGWLLPQLFAASRVHGLARKKPAILIPAFIGRPTFLISALAVLYLAVPNPTLAVTIFLAGFGIFNMSDGISSVPWFDLFSRAVPPWRRGRFIGSTQVVSAILAIIVGGIVGYILSERSPFQYPVNYAVLFFITTGFLGLSMLFTLSIRETPGKTDAERLTLRDYLRELKGIWRGDRDFRLITAIRLLLALTALSSPFYTVYALNVKGVSMGTVGWFLSAQVAGGLVYSIIGGVLLERFGGRLTTNIEAVLALIAPVLGIVSGYFLPSGSPWFMAVYLLLFASMGAMNNSFMLGHMNYLLEMSPDDKRALYVGLSNTLTGIIIVVPLLGGALVNLISYEPVYILTALCVAPTLALTLRLSEPRKRAGRT